MQVCDTEVDRAAMPEGHDGPDTANDARLGHHDTTREAPNIMHIRNRLAGGGVILAVGLSLFGNVQSAAATATSETINGVGGSGGGGSTGSAGLTLTVPGAVAFPITTLNGTNQSQSANVAINMNDASGNAAGWNVSATSTSFLAAGPIYITTLITAAAPVWACTGAATCTTATNSGVVYALTIPQPGVQGGAAPAGVKLDNAAVGSGIGDQNTSQAFTMTIPANTKAGAYSATWTFTYASAP